MPSWRLISVCLSYFRWMCESFRVFPPRTFQPDLRPSVIWSLVGATRTGRYPLRNWSILKRKEGRCTFNLNVWYKRKKHTRRVVWVERSLADIRVPFYIHGLTLIPAWISNPMPSKVWDEISYPFPKLQRLHRWSLGIINNVIPHFIMDVITYPCWD